MLHLRLGAGQIIVTTHDRSLLTNNPCSIPVVLDVLTSTESMQLMTLLVSNIPQDLAQFLLQNLEFHPAFIVSAARQVKFLSDKKKKPLSETWREIIENIKNRYKEEELPYYIAAMDETTRSDLESVIESTMKRSNVIEECFHLVVLARGSYLPLGFVIRFLLNHLNITEQEAEISLRNSPLIRVCDNGNITVNRVVYKLLHDVLASAVRTERMIHRLRNLSKFCISNAHETSVAKVFKVLSPKIMQYIPLLDLCFPENEQQRSLHHELGKAFLCVLVDYSSAVRCFTKAISIFEESNLINNPEYAQLLNSLGNVLRLTGSMKDACAYLSKSLKILKATSRGDVSEDVASCLSSLGLVCLSQGNKYYCYIWLMKLS